MSKIALFSKKILLQLCLEKLKCYIFAVLVYVMHLEYLVIII